MVINRRPLYFNSHAQQWYSNPSADLEDAFRFHKGLPGYAQTDLIPLDSLAHELKLGKVYVKHEGDRLGLPSFKILGASWGTYRAVLKAYNLPMGADVKAIQAATASTTTALFAATDGNHGRAVARLAQMFGMPAKIFVPANMDANMITGIKSEGAEVINTGKSYDDAILEAARGSATERGLLIQDCGFDDYQELPEWIVDGYSTCLREIDMQLGEETADLVIVPAGVGSLAQAVVTHYRRPGSATTVMAVEPDSAACLWKSLRQGESVSIRTTPTIMNGLDCGTVSTTAWPILQPGIGAAVTIADQESHQAVMDFNDWGVHTGPCGAAGLAALHRLSAADKDTLGLTKDSVVVLLSTEAARPYKVPRDTRLEDPAQLVEQLTNIMSISSRSGKHERPVETSIAEHVMAWLEHRDIECHWLENITGRPSVVGVVRGNGDGKKLMLHGNLDFKPNANVPPLGPGKARTQGTRVYGDGAANMKGGLAANMLALARAKAMSLCGDVILTAVAGGNGTDVGIEQVRGAGWQADAVVVTKPTGERLVCNSNGTVFLEVDVHGGSDGADGFVDLETDPITQAAYFLVELDKCRRRKSGTTVELRDGLQRVSVLEPGANSASCTVALEWQTVTGETADVVKTAIHQVLGMVSQKKPSFRFSLRVTSSHDPFSTSLSDPFVSLVSEVISRGRKQTSGVAGDTEWADCAALSKTGVPLIAWGPVGAASNASKGNEEWVDVESVSRVADGLMAIAKAFCA